MKETETHRNQTTISHTPISVVNFSYQYGGANEVVFTFPDNLEDDIRIDFNRAFKHKGFHTVWLNLGGKENSGLTIFGDNEKLNFYFPFSGYTKIEIGPIPLLEKLAEPSSPTNNSDAPWQEKVSPTPTSKSNKQIKK